MVKDLKTAEKYCRDNKDEETTFDYLKLVPIVLVKKKKLEEMYHLVLIPLVFILPYTGLHHLLFSYFKSDALDYDICKLYLGKPMII